MADAKRIEQFDAVIVGSGFAGSVAAWRLSEAGKSVCVLERGRAYPPGSFPRTPHELRNLFWEPSKNRRGLYDVWSFGGVRAVVASGLGGGSLIYANVLLRKDPETFVRERLDDGGYESWPITAEELAPHYQAIEDEIGPECYPMKHAPYASTPKSLAIAQAFEDLGIEYEHPPLAVRFSPSRNGGPPRTMVALEDDPENIHDVERHTCRLCGECDIGCNEGAKSTMDLTLLSAAWRHGAQVRTLCEAKVIRPDRDGFEVHYVQDVAHREGHPARVLDPSPEKDRVVHGRIVLVAAGALGSTRLLLENRLRLQGLSPVLGTRFSANGDLLSFALDCRDGKPPPRFRRDRRPWRSLEPQFGPVITTSGRIPDDKSGSGREILIQDGGQPALANWGWHARDMPKIGVDLAGIWWRRKWAAFLGRRRDTSLGDELSRAFGDGGASSSMIPMLAMGRDVPGGRLYLSGDSLQCTWNTKASSRYYEAVEDRLRAVSRQLGGRPVRADVLQRMRVISVHPLGGCPMGASWREGVVDSRGEAFGQRGLFVTDGAAMPGAVGANPSFTISAFTHLCVDRMLERLP